MRLTNNCFKFLALPFLAGLFMSFGSENPPYQGGRREEISCKALLGGPLTPGPSPPMGARGKKSLELTPSPPLGERVAAGRVREPIIFILDGDGIGGSSTVQFFDVAQTAGLRDRVVNGGDKTKKYVFESTGSGVAVFDYDGDGHPDIFMVNGSRLEGFPPGQLPTNHLYRNNGDATFVDVTAQAGLAHSGWGQGVCAGDYDNDGNSDLFVTYYGSSNLLYHNEGKGRFSNVTHKAGLDNVLRNWSTGCAFVD
ncbi:MAG: hypothetical protein DMG06_25750, partial [Acidobacteria bacterium]